MVEQDDLEVQFSERKRNVSCVSTPFLVLEWLCGMEYVCPCFGGGRKKGRRMPWEGREAFGAVLSEEVLSAIEGRKKKLGSPTLTSAEVGCIGPVAQGCAAAD